jgi:zinc transport system permease protein
MIDFLVSPFFMQILVGVLIGIGAGYLGAFMILRRMSLIGDALSHVALPGIALALLFNINPFIGAFVFLFAAIVGISLLEKSTDLPSETLVGIFFTISLALGLILTPEPELLEALFGDISKVGLIDVIITGLLVAIILIVMRLITRNIMLGIISKDLTKSMGIKADRTNFVFLLLVATVVALGLKIVGTLLMGSLVIIPAAAARNISLSLKHYVVISVIFGALSAITGIPLALALGFTPGPIIVLTSGLIFLVTLVFKR